MIPIWVGDTQLRKRLYFQFFHCVGIFGGCFVIMASQMQQRMDNQMRGMVFHSDRFLAGLTLAGFPGQRDITQHFRGPLSRKSEEIVAIQHGKGQHIGGLVFFPPFAVEQVDLFV